MRKLVRGNPGQRVAVLIEYMAIGGIESKTHGFSSGRVTVSWDLGDQGLWRFVVQIDIAVFTEALDLPDGSRQATVRVAD